MVGRIDAHQPGAHIQYHFWPKTRPAPRCTPDECPPSRSRPSVMPHRITFEEMGWLLR